MLKQKYALLTDQYHSVVMGKDKSEICETHLAEIFKLQQQLYKLQNATPSQDSTLDQESLQIRMLKSQYEREKKFVDEKVRELANASYYDQS